MRVAADPLHEQDVCAKPHTARVWAGGTGTPGADADHGGRGGGVPLEDPRAGAQGQLALPWHVSQHHGQEVARHPPVPSPARMGLGVPCLSEDVSMRMSVVGFSPGPLNLKLMCVQTMMGSFLPEEALPLAENRRSHMPLHPSPFTICLEGSSKNQGQVCICWKPQTRGVFPPRFPLCLFAKLPWQRCGRRAEPIPSQSVPCIFHVFSVTPRFHVRT